MAKFKDSKEKGLEGEGEGETLSIVLPNLRTESKLKSTSRFVSILNDPSLIMCVCYLQEEDLRS